MKSTSSRIFPILSIILMGAILRIILIIICSKYENILKHQLGFTDIDYKVITDAAMRQSPYDRHTFRYTPLLAYLMKMNHIVEWAGKLFFVIFDCIAMAAIAKLMKQQSRNVIIKLYAFNPLFIILTVRGSCQSITLALMFWSFYFIFENNGNTILNNRLNFDAKMIKRKNVYFGYLIYGLLVHFRIYPIVFLPVLLVHQYTVSKRTNSSFFIKFINISIVAGGTFLGLLALFYHLYGYIFIQQTYLYHLKRLDNRHSFSPFFYEIYLSLSSQSALRMLPQIAVIFTVSKQLHRKISPFYAIFMITYAFVSFNKVITMQYYMWVWGTLFMLLPESSILTNSHRRIQKSFNYTIQWLLGVAVWVWFSRKLELQGDNIFFGMWFICICKLFLDIWVVLGFLQTIRNIHGYKAISQNQ